MSMEFYPVCKTCGAEVPQDKLAEHLLTHDPLAFYNVLPRLAWEKK